MGSHYVIIKLTGWQKWEQRIRLLIKIIIVNRSTAIEIAFVEPENAVRHTRGREYNERGRNRLILPSEIIPTL